MPKRTVTEAGAIVRERHAYLLGIRAGRELAAQGITPSHDELFQAALTRYPLPIGTEEEPTQ